MDHEKQAFARRIKLPRHLCLRSHELLSYQIGSIIWTIGQSSYYPQLGRRKLHSFEGTTSNAIEESRIYQGQALCYSAFTADDG